jgi:hypothetical protein
MVPRLIGGAVQGGSNALASFGGSHGWSPYLVSGMRNFGYAAGMAALTGDATLSTGLLLLKGAANTLGRGGVLSTLVDVGTDYGLMYNAYNSMPASFRVSITDTVNNIGPSISHAATSVYNWAEPGLRSLGPAMQSLGTGISTFANNEMDYYFPWHDNAGQVLSQAGHDIGTAATDFWQGFQGAYSHMAIPEIKNPFAGFNPADIHIPQIDFSGVKPWFDNLGGDITCAYNNAVHEAGTFTSSISNLGSGTPVAQYNPFAWDWDFMKIDFSGNYLNSH